MNSKLFFTRLAKKNIHNAEFRYKQTKNFYLEVFKNQLTNFTSSISSSITVDAIINNKFVMTSTENIKDSNIDNLINILIQSSKYADKKGALIYKKKTKYEKFDFYNKDLDKVPTKKKIDLIFNIEKQIKKYDKRFTDVQVSYSEKELIYDFDNSYESKMHKINNIYAIGAYIIVKENKETKAHYESFTDNDFNSFNIKNFIKEACTNALKKLHPVQDESNKYNVVFSPSATSTLLEYYVSQLNAELILKNSSWFKGKINKKIAGNNVTIFETPLKKDFFFTSCDDQGVPTKNLTLINKGVLKTYLHNLETARAFKVESNGHASLSATKMGIEPHSSLYLKPGKLSKEELLKKVGNGIYIEELEGLHAGMNAQNGNFSLKTEGFKIVNGKIKSAMDMMTINGNLFNIFKNIKDISENIEYVKKGFFAPCIYLKDIAISF